jgi:hypothetical protein
MYIMRKCEFKITIVVSSDPSFLAYSNIASTPANAPSVKPHMLNTSYPLEVCFEKAIPAAAPEEDADDAAAPIVVTGAVEGTARAWIFDSIDLKLDCASWAPLAYTVSVVVRVAVDESKVVVVSRAVG